MDSKYLKLEKVEKIGYVPFKKWIFLYYLSGNHEIIKTTFVKSQNTTDNIIKGFKIVNIYDDLFKKYFKIGRQFDLPKIDISNFPNNYQRVYEYMTKHWNRIFYYGELADLCGIRNGARFIGYLMKVNPIPLIIPCHHVIGRTDHYLFSLGRDLKKELLILEGRKDQNYLH